jgi:hypothetical protein
VRTEGAAKGLRDDHTALNLVYLSYTMLHTTATALGDSETASLAKRSFIECAKFVTEIDRLVPMTVFRELQDGDFPGLDATAPEITRSAILDAWVAPSQSERSGATTGRI